jgi:hypothetical protein
MTSRLYRTTRPLAAQIALMLGRLGISGVGSPTTVALIALYVSGLILLDGRQTQTRVALFLPGRAHDALNRLLRVMPLSTRALMKLLITWVGRRHQEGEGYLCLDDVVIEKAFAKRLSWAGWTYSFAKKRKVYGLHIVVVLWCSERGRWRIPLAFRLWRPKRSCAPHAYQTKLSGWRRLCSRRSSVRGSAPQIHRLRHSLQLRVVYQVRGKAGAYLGGNIAPSDDRTLAWSEAIRRRVGPGAASQVAQAARNAHRGRECLRAQVRLLAVGRDQKPSRQPRVHRHKRPGGGPHHCGFAQDEPLVYRDALSRHQAVCGTGGVPMPGGSGDGSPRRPRSSHFRCYAVDAPVCGGERGFGQGTLADGVGAGRRTAAGSAQGLSIPPTSHRVSPVNESGTIVNVSDQPVLLTRAHQGRGLPAGRFNSNM